MSGQTFDQSCGLPKTLKVGVEALLRVLKYSARVHFSQWMLGLEL